MEKSRIEDLKDLFGEKYKLSIKEKEIWVEPLTLKQMAKFSMFQEKKDLAGAFEYVIVETLKSGIEGITTDQINKLKPEVLADLIPQIMKGNGLEGDAEKKLSESLLSKSESNLD